MRIIEMTIPTRHGYWKVVLGKSYINNGVSFYVNDKKHNGFWTPVGDRTNHREVPKTIWKKARCFFAAPERYGRVRYI